MTGPARTAVDAPAHAWLVALTVGVAAAMGYWALPYGPLAGAFYVAATFAASATVGTAAVWRRDRIAAPAGGLLAAALALAGIGHAYWYTQVWLGLEPLSLLVDAFYLAAYPLFGMALWSITRHSPRDEGAISDALIVGIAVAVVGWAVLIQPYVYDASLTGTQLLVATAYPVADVLLLPLVLRLLQQTRARINGPSLLSAGILAYVIADVVYAHSQSWGWYAAGGVADGIWLVAYSLFAAAAWHPVAFSSPLDRPDPTISPETRIVVLGAMCAFLPFVILVVAGGDVVTVRIAAIGSILVFILVMHRLYWLVHTTTRQRALLEVLAQTDALTGAANRRYLNQVLEREVARCERTSAELSLAFLDLDHFKSFNDTHGHEVGDRLLVETVEAWRREMRPMDLLARVGGEEFVVVLPDSDIHQCHAIVERLRSLVPEGQTCSAGMTHFVQGDTGQSLISRADEAVYRAKRRGRNQAATSLS